MTNTKARHQEILAAAVRVLGMFGGVETVDAFPQDERIRLLRKMADNVVSLTNCTRPPARNNVAKAMRRARFAIMQGKACCKDRVQEQPDNWGGARPNTGPPRLPEGQKRQPVSTRLGPGYKELAQGIAKVKKLPGWGRAVERALVKWVEQDRELKSKLAEIGIIVKGNDGKRGI